MLKSLFQTSSPSNLSLNIKRPVCRQGEVHGKVFSVIQ